MLDLRRTVHDGISFDWNGQRINFADWQDDQYGEFSYLTRDGEFQFAFDLQPVAGEVRIYILEQPSYQGRSIRRREHAPPDRARRPLPRHALRLRRRPLQADQRPRCAELAGVLGRENRALHPQRPEVFLTECRQCPCNRHHLCPAPARV